MTEWYYEDKGAQRGPITETDLNTMLVDHLLPPNTLVWTASLGSAWKPASQTDLDAAPPPVKPPPLPTATALPPPLPAATAGTHALGRQATFAPPAGSPVKSFVTEKWAMWLASTPFIFIAIDIILTSIGIDPYGGSPQARGATIWCGIGTFWLAYKDAKAINDAGANPQRRRLLPFMLLLPIAYFIRRKMVASTSLTPLWIWLVGMVVYVLGVGALSAR